MYFTIFALDESNQQHEKHDIFSFLLLLSILPAHASGDEPTIKSLLKELDRTIAMKADFHKQREHEIDSIRKLAHTTSSPEEKYHLYSSLYGIYLHYQADSALHYLEKGKHSFRPSKIHSTRTIYGSQEPKCWESWDFTMRWPHNWNRYAGIN